MKVQAMFDLPLDEEELSRVVEKARETGLPLMAVVLEISDSEIAEYALARGATREQIEGFVLGQRLTELRDEFASMGPHGGVRFFGAEIIPEDSPAAVAYEPLTPALPPPLVAREQPGKKRKTRA